MVIIHPKHCMQYRTSMLICWLCRTWDSSITCAENQAQILCWNLAIKPSQAFQATQKLGRSSTQDQCNHETLGSQGAVAPFVAKTLDTQKTLWSYWQHPSSWRSKSTNAWCLLPLELMFGGQVQWSNAFSVHAMAMFMHSTVDEVNLRHDQSRATAHSWSQDSRPQWPCLWKRFKHTPWWSGCQPKSDSWHQWICLQSALFPSLQP